MNFLSRAAFLLHISEPGIFLQRESSTLTLRWRTRSSLLGPSGTELVELVYVIEKRLLEPAYNGYRGHAKA